MAAWRRAAATCSLNWNASINPGSGRGCAASPCWNRNAASATKPPANSASTSAVWLPTQQASPAPSVPIGPSRTACTGPWMSPSTTTRCAPAPKPQPIIWRCSNTSPSTLSDSTRSNVKAASKPADSSPLPQTYTALNCSDSYDVHAIALTREVLSFQAPNGWCTISTLKTGVDLDLTPLDSIVGMQVGHWLTSPSDHLSVSR